MGGCLTYWGGGGGGGGASGKDPLFAFFHFLLHFALHNSKTNNYIKTGHKTFVSVIFSIG